MSFSSQDWNAKVGSQKIPGLTGEFDLGAQNEAGQRLKTKELCQENALVTATQEMALHMGVTKSSALKSD